GQDATPIWIPQMSMAIGSVIFAIALFDNLVRVILFGTHSAGSQILKEEE
ncbi:MAG: TRAP transporter small permease, partial [Rhodobacteraceae bacterium]|nr:TRAP transporter small permease [Paracoccaceae bacterium]